MTRVIQSLERDSDFTMHRSPSTTTRSKRDPDLPSPGSRRSPSPAAARRSAADAATHGVVVVVDVSGTGHPRDGPGRSTTARGHGGAPEGVTPGGATGTEGQGGGHRATLAPSGCARVCNGARLRCNRLAGGPAWSGGRARDRRGPTPPHGSTHVPPPPRHPRSTRPGSARWSSRPSATSAPSSRRPWSSSVTGSACTAPSPTAARRRRPSWPSGPAPSSATSASGSRRRPRPATSSDDDDRYSLSPEQAALFTDEDSPAFVMGGFQGMNAAAKADELLTEAMRTGRGVGWGEHHHDLFRGTERFFRPGYKANLVQPGCRRSTGVVEELEAGATVADVGCGYGASTSSWARPTPPRPSSASTRTPRRSTRPGAGRDRRPGRSASGSRSHRPRSSPAPATGWCATSTACTTWVTRSAPWCGPARCWPTTGRSCWSSPTPATRWRRT